MYDCSCNVGWRGDGKVCQTSRALNETERDAEVMDEAEEIQNDVLALRRDQMKKIFAQQAIERERRIVGAETRIAELEKMKRAKIEQLQNNKLDNLENRVATLAKLTQQIEDEKKQQLALLRSVQDLKTQQTQRVATEQATLAKLQMQTATNQAGLNAGLNDAVSGSSYRVNTDDLATQLARLESGLPATPPSYTDKVPLGRVDTKPRSPAYPQAVHLANQGSMPIMVNAQVVPVIVPSTSIKAPIVHININPGPHDNDPLASLPVQPEYPH